MCKIDPGCSITENKSFDITQFNGQTVKLRLRVTSSSGDGAFADFDDVQITVALPRTTLSITNVNFQSDSQFVSGWINLDNPFSSWQEARDYVFTVNSAGHVGDEAARNFGSIPVTMDITNTGTVKAIDVNAVIDVQYTLDYNACFEILLCTSHGTYARGDQKLVQLGDINPGESIHVNTSFDIRFASVMALFAFVPPGEWSAIVITAVPKFGGVATQETVSAAGRNTDIVSVKVPYSIGGLNTAEIGVALILEAASSAGADLAKNLNDLAVGVGNSAGVNTQFAVQAGKILSGQRKEIFYEVVANAFHLTIFLTHQGSTIKLVAVDPDESTYSIKTHEGVGEISVENPIPGSWKIRVIGVDLPSDGESFTTNISSAARNTFCGKTSDKFDNIIHGTPIDDELVGTNRNDLIFGLEGNDIINGKKGNDCLIGGSGNDEIRGGAGNDVIEGNEGDDTIYGGSGNDKINGGDDNDLCKGGKGNNVINNCEDLTATGSELE
jgi:Ca2+-binding RTX toxin-like protein